MSDANVYRVYERRGNAVSGWLRKLQVTFSEWRPVTAAMALMDVDLLLEDEMSSALLVCPSRRFDSDSGV